LGYEIIRASSPHYQSVLRADLVQSRGGAMGWGKSKRKSDRLDSPRKTRANRLAIESLEPRQLLSVAQTLVNPTWMITNDIGPAGLSAGDTVSDGGAHADATYLVNAFSTLQEGIDNADSGGEVVLLPGNYSGTLSINKPIKLTALAGATTSNLAIDLNSGADLAGSTGVAANTVRVHAGAHVSDGVLLAAAGATVTVDAGSYADDVTLSRSIKLLSSGGTATVNSFTLAAGLLAGTIGVTSTTVNVNSGAKIQDAMTLASSTAQTTITVAASSSSETVTITKNILFVGTTKVTKFILSAGAAIASPSDVTSTAISLASGVNLQDAINLASTSAMTIITLPGGPNSYAETVTLSKNIRLSGTSTTTISAVILDRGESFSTTGVTVSSTSITVNNGGKVADAVKLASSSALSTITLEPGTYSDSLTIGKSLRFNSSGVATIGSVTLNPGAAIDPLSSGVSSTNITVAPSARIQDALYLASTTAQTSILLQGASYAETVTIATTIRFTGTPAIIDAIILNDGAAIGAGNLASSLDITVNNGANISAALAFASASSQTLITLAPGDYNGTATLNTSIKFAGGPATLNSIILQSGAAIDPASTGVTASQITVNGGKVQDALRLAATGTLADPTQITLTSAAYAESIQIPAKFIRFSTTDGPATLANITLSSGAIIDALSSGVTAPIITVNSGARVQDAVALVAGGTSQIKLQPGDYPDAVTINKPLQLRTITGTATLASITLAAGANLTGSGNVTSTDIHVEGGTLADAMLLAATGSPASPTVITLTDANYAETVNISKDLQFIGAATVTSIILNPGGNIASPAGITSTSITVNNGAPIQAGISALAPGATLTLTPGVYAGDLTIDKSLSIVGPQMGIDGARNLPTENEAIITGSLTITPAATAVTLDGLTIDNGKPDSVIISHATGALTLRNNIINADHAPAPDYTGPTLAIDNAADVELSQNRITTYFDPAAANLAIGFEPQPGFTGVSHTLTFQANDIAGSVALAGLAGADVAFTNNTLHNGSAAGISLSGASIQNLTLFANTLSDHFLAALQIDGVNLTATGQFTIDGNTLTHNQTALHLSGPLAPTSIQNNFITTNSAQGILIDANTTGITAIDDNYISSNTTGLRNDSSQLIDATANYWGRDDGPTSPLNTWNGSPTGDTIVGDNLFIAPWYTDGTDTDLDAPGYQPLPLDTTPPTISAPDLADQSDSGDLSDDNITNNNTPTLTGTASPGAAIALFENTILLASSQADLDGNWSITLSTGLADGAHDLTARATSQSGNSTTSAALTLLIDTLAPLPNAGGPRTINENDTITLTGVFTDPPDDAASSRAWHFISSTNPQTIADTPGDTLTFQALDNGAYTFRYDITDAAGNSASDFAVVTVNNIAPTAMIQGLPDNTLPAGVPIHLSAIALDPGTLDTLTYVWAITKTKDGITTPFADQTTSDTLLRSDDFTFIPDQGATYTLSLTLTDNDGDSTTTTASLTAADANPTVTLAGSQSKPANVLPNVAEASPFILTISPASDPVTQYHIHWGDDSAETILTEVQLTAANRQVTHSYADGFAAPDASAPTHTISVDLLSASGTQYYPDAGALDLIVFDAPPKADISGSASVNEGSSATVLLFNPADPSATDAAAGYSYSFDFNNDGNFEINNVSSPGTTIPATYFADGPFDRTVAARIFDKDGFFTQYSHTIHVNNIAPTLNPGGPALTAQDVPFTRTVFFADPGSDTWTATADFGDNSDLQTLSINPNKSFNLLHTFALPGTYTITLHLTDKDLAAATASFDITVQATTLQVAQFTPTATGADIRFNRPIDLTALNLYDVNPAAQPDLTLTGAVNGPVHGSAVWDSSTNTLHFIKTGAPLAADLYTLTLAGRADSFIDLAGSILDGDADNAPGGDYIQSFSTTLPAAVLTLPDFARGPGQSIDLPITLTDAQNVQSLDFDLHYDPALLHINTALLSAGLPADWTLTANATSPGILRITLFGATSLPAGARELIHLIADVPASAPYKAAQALTFTSLRINEGAIPAIADAAVQKVAYFGDATGDGTLGAFDANRISRVVTQLDGTFAGPASDVTAYPLTDPLIIADITGDGTLSGLDAALVAQKFTDPDSVPQIPDVPAIGAIVPAAIDPTLSLPGHLTVRPDGTIDIPLSISDAPGFFAADVTLDYDSTLLDLNSAVLSDELANQGWALSAHATAGQLRISLYSTGEALPAGVPDLVTLTFKVSPDAADFQSLPLHLVALPSATRLNEGQLALSTSDGSLIVDATRPTVASQFLYDLGQSIQLDFSEALSTPLSTSNFTLLNLTTNQVIPASSIALVFAGQTASLTFVDLPNNQLPDGRYSLTLTPAITDLAGNRIDDPEPLSFFTLTGDADHDAAVGFSDLVTVAQHYGQNNPDLTWSTGDFNHDGQVSFADLVTVAQHYGNTLIPPQPAPAAIAPAPSQLATKPQPIVKPTSPTPFTTRPIAPPARNAGDILQSKKKPQNATLFR
jgi:hypothetical protein